MEEITQEKERHKIALETEVKRNTQGGKYMNKHGMLPWHSLNAYLGTFSSIYLSNLKANHKRKRKEEKSSCLIPKPNNTAIHTRGF